MPEHWSETAARQANQSANNGAADNAVVDCEDRLWEPLAETEELPDWELQAEIDESDDDMAAASGEPGESEADKASGDDDSSMSDEPAESDEEDPAAQ